MAALKPIRQEKSLLKKDIKSMEEGTLGLSEAEQRQLTDKALRDAQRATQTQSRAVQRQAMASGGPAGQFMGQAAALQRDFAKQAQEQAAAASSEAAAVSRDLAERRAEKTRERISQEAARRRQQPRKIAGSLGTAFQAVEQFSQDPYVRSALETVGTKLENRADLAEKEEVKATESGETPAIQKDTQKDTQKAPEGGGAGETPDTQKRPAGEVAANVMTSTAKGASTGAMVGGPWGAVIGGGIGLVSSLAQQSAEGKKRKRARQEQDKRRQEAERARARAARDGAEARPEAQQPTTQQKLQKLDREAFLNADTPQQKAIARALGMTVDQVTEFIESEKALGGKIQQQFVQPVASSLGFGG
jgi:hypothetical protein